jgi:hypothetical protein
MRRQAEATKPLLLSVATDRNHFACQAAADETAMKNERAKIVKIQDLLINLYVEPKEAFDKGQKSACHRASVRNKRAQARNSRNKRLDDSVSCFALAVANAKTDCSRHARPCNGAGQRSWGWNEGAALSGLGHLAQLGTEAARGPAGGGNDDAAPRTAVTKSRHTPPVASAGARRASRTSEKLPSRPCAQNPPIASVPHKRLSASKAIAFPVMVEEDTSRTPGETRCAARAAWLRTRRPGASVPNARRPSKPKLYLWG